MEPHSLNPAFLFLNRSFFTLKSCIESFTEVEDLMGQVSSRLDRHLTADSKPATLRTASISKRTNMCSVYQELAARGRKSKRLSVTPGPGQYLWSPITSHRPEVRMEGRPDVPQSSSPGPAAYVAETMQDLKFGYWSREPKDKHVILDNSHLGPGTYDSRSFINRGQKGHNIDAGNTGSSNGWNTSHTNLGPGQYILKEGYSKRGYTISKTQKTGNKFNPHLGPGKYEPLTDRPTGNCKFSTSPRFDNSFQDKINSK